MTLISDKELVALGKKYQKFFEYTNVEIFPYKINENRYFLTYYKGKLNPNGIEKACAIVSPDANHSAEEAVAALKPLVFFTVSLGNLQRAVKGRAELKYDFYEDIREYLKGILDANVLEHDLTIIYKRSYEIIDNMIVLQEEMIDLWKKIESIISNIKRRGYFTNEELETFLNYVPKQGWIQYAQFKDRYIYRKDFDVIYENRNKPEIRKLDRLNDDKLLLHMTSNIAAQQLKKSLDSETDGIDLSDLSQQEYEEFWFDRYTKRLEGRVSELKSKLRYPTI